MTDKKTREEQINLIRRSTADWNAWRAGRTDRANLVDADLRDADLQDADLRDANLADANLAYTNLAFANLMRANLADANLEGANLAYANLEGAKLANAKLADAKLGEHIKIVHLVCRAIRSDDYTFFGFVTNAGLRIKAGCRLMTPDEYREHVADEYPDTPKAMETLSIIKYLEDCGNG